MFCYRLSKPRLALQEVPGLSNISNPPKRGLQDLPKGYWTKTTKGLPGNFSEEDIKAYHSNSDAKKHLNAGYRMFRSHKVKDVLLNFSVPNTVFCKANVEASFSLNKKYVTQVKLSTSSEILGGYCECAAGLGGVCKHVGAVLWFVFDVIKQGDKYIQESKSCTEEERKWGIGSKKCKLSERKFSDLQFVKHDASRPKVSPQNLMPHNAESEAVELKPEHLVNLHHALSKSGFSPMMCAIFDDHSFLPVCQPVNLGGSPSNPPTDRDTSLTASTELFERRLPLPVAVLWAECDVGVICEDFTISLDLQHAQELEQKTQLQSGCQLWHTERQRRITASKFGNIVSRQADITTKFVDSIFKSGSFQSKYMQEGLNNEETAIKKYESLKCNLVKTFDCGFVVNPGVPFLGSSPDKVVYDKTVGEFGLVEIKTLAKAKEMGMSIAQAILNKKATFLKKKCGTLSQNHKYFYQIQGQLALTGLTWCDLVVDSGIDMYIERIHFDQGLWLETMLPKLALFYCRHAVGLNQENEMDSQAL